MAESKPLTVRVSSDLVDRAYTLSAVSGETMRDIVSRGLERELGRMMDNCSGEFESAVTALQVYKASLGGA